MTRKKSGVVKRIIYTIIVLHVVILISCSDDSTTELDDNLNFIENTVAGFSRSINRNDTIDLASLVSDSVMIIHPNRPPQQGLAAFNRFILQNNWEQFQMTNQKIDHGGGISVVTSSINYKIDQPKPNVPIKYKGEILLYIRKQDDGFWKIHKLAYSSWKIE